MKDALPETLFVEDRTRWSPQPRGGGDRRALWIVAVALACFAALVLAHPRRAVARSARALKARTVHYVALAPSPPPHAMTR